MVFKFDKKEILPPHKIVCDSISLIKENFKTVLDVGAGTGRNSIYLSQIGFIVDAIDKSSETINILNEFIYSNSLQINASSVDIINFTPDFYRYNLILFIQVLHYLPRPIAISILEKAILHSRRNAVHIIGAVTKSGDFFKIQNSDRFFYPCSNEVKNFYETNNWTIHRSFLVDFEMRQLKKNGEKMKNKIAFVVAQKLSG